MNTPYAPRHTPFVLRKIQQEVVNLQGQMGITLSGHFTLVKRKAVDESIVEVYDFDNLITDGGLDRWGSGSVINKCQVGSGNATPTVTDTGLQALVATTTTTRSVTAPFNAFAYDSANRSQTYTACFRFDTGVAAGTLAEVAMGWTAAPAGIWCRALILDDIGNPTTITLLSDEILDVYYAIKLQFPAADNTGTVVIAGTTYNWTGRPANLAAPSTFEKLFNNTFLGGTYASPSQNTYTSYWYAYTGSIGAATTTPGGTILGGAWRYHTAPAYVSGSYSRSITGTTSTDEGNGTFSAVRVEFAGSYSNPQFQYQFGFSPSITKTSTQIFSLTCTVTWSRG